MRVKAFAVVWNGLVSNKYETHQTPESHAGKPHGGSRVAAADAAV